MKIPPKKDFPKPKYFIICFKNLLIISKSVEFFSYFQNIPNICHSKRRPTTKHIPEIFQIFSQTVRIVNRISDYSAQIGT
jgi:hypothetical protein